MHCWHFWRTKHSHWGLTRWSCDRCCQDCGRYLKVVRANELA